jgi:hypothetical protein
MPARRRSWSERLVHGIAWRLARARSRVRDRIPPYLRVVRELHATTGRSSGALAADMLAAWRNQGFEPADYAALMLWDVPELRRPDYLVSKTLDPFLESLLDPADLLLGRDKAAFAAHDAARGVPWLPTLAVVNRHEGGAVSGVPSIERPEDLWPALRALADDRAVALKPAFGLQGRGFFVVSPSGEVVDADSRPVSEHELVDHVFHYALRGTHYGYLVQPFVRSHERMAALTGVDALSTLRIVTVRHPSGNFLLQTFLKIPAPGRLTDNFRRGVSGTFIVGVDPRTGVLGDCVGLAFAGARHAIARADVHPLTGKRIAGEPLPMWSECSSVAERAAAAHPRSPIFGWDVGLAPEGWFVLDPNPRWGPIAGQVTTREGLRPKLAALYPDYWK